MDVGKIHSYSSNNKLFTEVDKKDIVNKEKGKDVSSDKITDHVFPGVSPIGTRVEFAIEKELNLVVTTVRDLDTEKIIRQLPPEDTISRMKMLKSYYNQIAQANLGNKVDEVVK